MCKLGSGGFRKRGDISSYHRDSEITLFVCTVYRSYVPDTGKGIIYNNLYNKQVGVRHPTESDVQKVSALPRITDQGFH